MTAIGLVGKKCGMTRIFDENGAGLPVTVISVEPNMITQIKTGESDGYDAVQVTMGARRASRVTKALKGHFAKAKVEPGMGTWEFRIDPKDASEDIKVGAAITVKSFEGVSKVDVAGETIGKGFAGGVKRHNFRTQDATHGNSLSHRAPGSIGQNQTPGRVFKGKKMAGHMGAVRRTTQSLEVVRIDEEKNLLLVKGAVPGSKQGVVFIKPAAKINHEKVKA